ncbi:MAG: pyrroline-5-carboxylate reductase [Pirellulaceae bacterium]
MSDRIIGFIGAGQMARALAGGFLAQGLVESRQVLAYDPAEGARQQFTASVAGARWAGSNADVVRQADVVLLAVKPQSFAGVVRELSEAVDPATGRGGTDRSPAGDGRVFISILAGVTLAQLSEGLRTERVVRVMPNTPCLIGRGASAYATGSGVTEDDAELVERYLAAVGSVHRLPESMLDAVTGLSGSGPAFVYLMVEALSDGGVRMGLPRPVATALAAQTLMGAAEMVLKTAEHPAVLKDRVASPAGTTIAGLQVLEQRALRSALIDAVEAAATRSRELSAASQVSRTG